MIRYAGTGGGHEYGSRPICLGCVLLVHRTPRRPWAPRCDRTFVSTHLCPSKTWSNQVYSHSFSLRRPAAQRVSATALAAERSIMNAIEEQVVQFLGQNFVLSGASELAADQSLMEARLIDSTGVLELVAFLEEQSEVQVADEALVPENLDTIANIAAFVERKRNGERRD